MKSPVIFDAFEELLLNYNPETDKVDLNFQHREGFGVAGLTDHEIIEFTDALTLKKRGDGL